MSLSSDCNVNNNRDNNNNNTSEDWKTYHGDPTNLDFGLADSISDCNVNNNITSEDWKTYHGGPANLDLRLADIIPHLEPLAPVIMRLKASSYPGIERISEDIDYPEVICTRNLKGSIYSWRNTELDGKSTLELLKPLRKLILTIQRELSGAKSGTKKVKLSTIERDDLGVLRKHYEDFANHLIETKGKKRLQFLKGRPRLYGLEEVYTMSLSKAHKIVSINKYKQVINKNTYGAGNVYWEGGVHFKRAPDENPMFPGLEWSVIFFGKRLFDQQTTDTKLVKIVGVWVRNIEAQCSYGSESRRKLTLFQTGKKVDEKHNAVEFFRAYPKIKEKYLFKEERKTYLMQISRSIEGDNLLDYINKKAYLKLTNLSTSINFVQAFGLRRSDDRADNFIVDRDGHVVGIDNDRAHGPPVWTEGGKLYLNVRSILLLFPEWNNKSLDSYVSETLHNLNPGQFILGWLGALHSQNKKYAELQKTGSFTKHDYDKLSLPITLPPSSINETYRLLVKLKKVTHDKSKSRWEIFKAVYPPIAALYEQMLIKSGGDPIAAQNLLFQGGLCRIDLLMEEIKDDIFDPDNPREKQLFADLKALALPEDEPSLTRTKLREKIGFLTPLKLAQKWLSAFPLGNCTEDEQISLINAALNAFPEWEALTLSQNTLEKKSLLDLADKKKRLKSLTLVSSRSPVSTGMVLDLMETGVSVCLIDTVLEDESVENLEMIMKFQKLQGGKVKFTTRKTPSSTIKVPFIASEDPQKANQVKLKAQQPESIIKIPKEKGVQNTPKTRTLLAKSAHTERVLVLKSRTDLLELSSAFQVKVSKAFANDKNLLKQLAEKLSDSTFRLLDLSDTEITDDDLISLIKHMPTDPIYFELSGCKSLTYEAVMQLVSTYSRSAARGNPYGQLSLGHMYFNSIGVDKAEDKARDLYNLAAEQELPEAQCCMGDCHRTGKGVDRKNLSEAVRCYKLASDQDNSRALHQLSICYTYGEGVPEPSNDKAVEYLRRAVSLGNIAATLDLAQRHKVGDGVEESPEIANKLYERAAEQGGDDEKQTLREIRRRNSLSPLKPKNSMPRLSPRKLSRSSDSSKMPLDKKQGEQFLLSSPKSEGPFILDSDKDLNQLPDICKIKISSNFAENEKLLSQLANQFSDTLDELDLSNTKITDSGLRLLIDAMPDAPIFFNLMGCSCLTKNGINPLIAKYTQAAAHGQLSAWIWAGHTYINYPHAQEEDQQQGASCYENAAELKYPEGQYHLARCYAKGLGVKKNSFTASKFYKKAAIQSHPEAQYCLAIRYQFGDGVARSMQQAMSWYFKAATANHVNACCALGYIYLKGNEMTDMDQKKAAQYFQQAANQGDIDAEQTLKKMELGKRRPSFTRSSSNVASLPKPSRPQFLTVRGDFFSKSWTRKKVVRKGTGAKKFGELSLTPECILMLRSRDDLSTLQEVLKAKVSKSFAKDKSRIQLLANELSSSLRELDLSNTEITFDFFSILLKNMPEDPVYFNILGCKLLSKKKERKHLIQTYAKSAKKGNASGQRCYGLLLLRGLIGKPDPKKAQEYFNSAAVGGDIWALDLVGECYSDPSWNDPYEANCFYKRAADQGLASAQCHLAENLWDGRGCDKKDRKEAFSLYSDAAEQGHALAQYKLALCYIEGKVCPENKPEAKRLLKLAMKQGNDDAKKALKEHFPRPE